MDIINFVVNIELVTQQVDQPCMAVHALQIDEVLTFYKCLISVYSIHVVPLDYIWKIQRFPLIAGIGGGGAGNISDIHSKSYFPHLDHLYHLCNSISIRIMSISDHWS